MSKLKLLSSSLSTQTLRYKPGGAPASFEVVVTNTSSEFATFQLELIAAGAEAKTSHWYQIAPDVSAKIPGGDRTRFVVTIVDVPPIPGGFAGTMTLTIRIFSLELRDEDRQVLNLAVEGSGVLSPKLELAARKFQAYPGELVEVPVTVHNRNRHTANVTVQIVGLERSWLVDGGEQRLQIGPNSRAETVLLCQLPEPTRAPSQAYRFGVEATQPQSTATRLEALLTVLPSGYVDFGCSPLRRRIPDQRGWWKNRKADTALYNLEFDNQSNLQQQARVEVQYQDIPMPLLLLSGGDYHKAQQRLKQTLEIIPEEAELNAGDTCELQLKVQQKRPWLGWVRCFTLQVKAYVSDARLDVRNDTQVLHLKVLPLIPIWLQLGLILLLSFVFLIPRVLEVGHTQPVNAVQFNGIGTEIISGSNDKSIRRWQVKGDRLRYQGVIDRDDKAVRVVRYRPVNNNFVAIGFENGQIQVRNLLTGKLQSEFVNQPDDRVFDLEFTQDSRTLYSGHGSGLISAWDLSAEGGKLTEPKQPKQQKQFDFAVYSTALIGSTESHLAVAGRFNRLSLWNLADDTVQSLPYTVGNKDHYIMSIATAEQEPYLLAAADNQGKLSLWNLDRCTQQGTSCELIDEWKKGHSEKSIHSIALSADGCYLASAGEDGRIKLWTLDHQNHRVLKETLIDRFRKPINAIDVMHLNQQVLIVTGGDNHRVRLHRVRDKHPNCGE